MFLEHPLRSSKKNMELAPNSRFFLELELLELDAFGMTRWWSWWSSWSGALPNTPKKALLNKMSEWGSNHFIYLIN